MSRPNISGRALRAHPALLGASATLAAAVLTVVPAAAGDASVASVASPSLQTRAGDPAPAAAAEPGALAGVSQAPAVGAALMALPRHTSLKIRRAGLNVLAGGSAVIAGALRPGAAGERIELQRLGRRGWGTISHTATRRGGRFVVRYVPRRLLSERVRVTFAGDSHELAAHRIVGRLTSYRLAGASWYGGGGWTACGGELTSATMGVANKTLPCGTLVTLRYRGRSVRVPVVDRGPYVAGRDFDLTEAVKRALDFEGVGEVWSTR